MSLKTFKYCTLIGYYIVFGFLALAVSLQQLVFFIRTGEPALFFYKLFTGQYISLKEFLYILGGLAVLGGAVILFSYVLFYLLYAFISARERVLKTIEHFTETEALTVIEDYTGPQRDGPFREYDNSGGLKYELNYKKGKLDGTCKEYYETGKPCLVVNVQDDLLEGPTQQFSGDGEVLKDLLYRKGKLYGVATRFSSDKKLQIGINDTAVGAKIKTFSRADPFFKQESTYANGRRTHVKIYDKAGKLLIDQNVDE